MHGTWARGLLVAAGVMLVTPGWAAGAKVVVGGGCARATPEETCKEVSVGDALATQTTLVAGKDGATLTLSDRTVVRLSPDAEVRLLPRTKLQLGKGDTLAEAMLLTRGRVQGEPVAPGALLVKSAQFAAVIKKGQGIVKTTDDGLLLAMPQGTGVIGSGSDYNDVLEGKVRVVSRGDARGAVRDLLRAPEARLSGSVVLSNQGSKGAKLSWKALEGAAGYEIEVKPPRGVATLRRMPREAAEFALSGLEAGVYEVAVRGVDAQDLSGPWSPLQRVQGVSVELPLGAVVQEDAVQLPEGAKVKLRPVDGLEASFDEVTTFVPAAPEVGLVRERGRTLRLRRRGESDEVRLRLLPRGFRASVELTPPKARWPRDPVQIELRLVSTNGLPPPADISLVPTVKLDLEPLAVTWTRDGDRMRATVAPRGDRKPHVVRVEVADQYGLPLGRGFLEIAPD